ncbi:hypothetical protein Ddc_10780 [Ditylenchus destructor]|nr:hypothetical protein Ddc_10780 [Ditylenchus destructor]
MSPYTSREHNATDCVRLLEEFDSYSYLDDGNGRFTPEETMETTTILPEGITVLNFIHINVASNEAAPNPISMTPLLNSRLSEKLNGNIVFAEESPTAPHVILKTLICDLELS